MLPADSNAPCLNRKSPRVRGVTRESFRHVHADLLAPRMIGRSSWSSCL